MAFTKTPEQDTHNKFRIYPRGNQTITHDTGPFTSQAGLRYVNCWPTIQESKTTDPRVVLVKAPAIKQKTWTFPDTDVGITAYDFETGLFVYGSKIYQATASGTSGPTITKLYTYGTAGHFLSCQKVIDYTLTGDTIITGLWANAATGAIYPYTYNKTTNTFVLGAAISAGALSYYAATYSDEVYVTASDEVASPRDLVIDGYHIVGLKAEQNGTNRVLVSDPGAYTTFSPTVNYFVPEIDPDDLVDIQKHKNMICVIGTKTIEFFFNAATEIGSPFMRQENKTIRLGAAQNMVSNGGSVSIANGDDIYFFANSLTGGNSLYLIRDFNAIKISDDYIDNILNNELGIVNSINPASAKLGLIDVMGSIHVGIEFTNTSTGAITTYVFNERDKVWWEYSDSDANGFKTTTNGIVSNFLGVPFAIKASVLGVSGYAQFSVCGATVNAAGSTITLSYVSKDPTHCAYAAQMITIFHDQESNNWKHLKFVDMLGDYGDNSITLSYSKTPDYSVWNTLATKYPTVPGTDQACRWYNLGQVRRMAFKAQWNGNSNIVHEMMEVAYNIRTQ